MFPHVDSVHFVRELQPGGPAVRYAVYRPEGRVRVASPAEVDSILRERAAPVSPGP